MTHLHTGKKRFSDDQIKSLEVVFRAGSRPEPKDKQRIARELGLQPRQVAVWFQNRRARSRTKDVEREFNALKAEYDKVASRFEAARRENQQLNDKLHELKARLGRSQGENGAKESSRTGNDDEPNNLRNGLQEGCDNEVEIADLGLELSADWGSCDGDESNLPLWWEFWS